MTWNKSASLNLGPQWETWTPTLNIQPDDTSSAPKWRSSISNFTWGECKYAVFDGEFFGYLNFTIGKNSNYGGTRVHWDMLLPQPVLNSSGKVIGHGFWYADTSALGYSTDAAGRVIVSTWGGGLSNSANFSFIKTDTVTDEWAMNNMSYSWGYVYVDGVDSTNWPGHQFYNTGFNNSSWQLFRLYRSSSAEPWWTAGHANGTVEPSTSDTARIQVSINLRYMVA